MTQPEFDRWIRDYCGKFPATAAWLNALGETIKGTQLALWCEVLARVEFRDAMAVSLRMARGDLERVGAFDSDREQTALIVKRACAIVARERTPGPRQTLDEPIQPPSANPGAFQGSFFGAYMRLIESGLSHAQATEKLAGTPDVRHAYRCLICCDRGLVQCYHPKVIEKILAGHDLEKVSKYSIWPACKCKAGDKYTWNEGDRSHGMQRHASVRYTEGRYCAVGADDVNGEESLAFLRVYVDWVKTMQEEREAAKLAAAAPAHAQRGLPYKDGEDQ